MLISMEAYYCSGKKYKNVTFFLTIQTFFLRYKPLHFFLQILILPLTVLNFLSRYLHLIIVLFFP